MKGGSMTAGGGMKAGLVLRLLMPCAIGLLLLAGVLAAQKLRRPDPVVAPAIP